MNYTLTSASGDINIPELQNIDYKGLKLIGRNTPNWNEPIQQNFIKLADKIDILEAKFDILNSGKEVFFISPDGSNSNDGSYDSPFENLVNVPNGGIVVLKNGLYEGMIQLDEYDGIPKVLYDEKDGEHIYLDDYHYTIIGESRDGVTIQVKGSEGRDNLLMSSHCDSKLINMTIDHYLTSSTNNEVSISKVTDRTSYDNIIFNIQGNYSLNYNNGTGIEEAVVYNNCQFNGGTKLNNYSGKHIINAESEFSPTASYTQIIQAL